MLAYEEIMKHVHDVSVRLSLYNVIE
jgi:hypothetical protein